MWMVCRGVTGNVLSSMIIKKEMGVVLGGDETHVFQNIFDRVVPVLRRSPQAVQCFIE